MGSAGHELCVAPPAGFGLQDSDEAPPVPPSTESLNWNKLRGGAGAEFGEEEFECDVFDFPVESCEGTLDAGCTSAGLDCERVSAVGDKKSDERLAKELNGIALGIDVEFVELELSAVGACGTALEEDSKGGKAWFTSKG